MNGAFLVRLHSYWAHDPSTMSVTPSTTAEQRRILAEWRSELARASEGGATQPIAVHLAESEAIEALRSAISLVTHPVDDAELAVVALTTAARFDHPVYDAMYAALARRLGGAVATRDHRLKDLLAKLRIDPALDAESQTHQAEPSQAGPADTMTDRGGAR